MSIKIEELRQNLISIKDKIKNQTIIDHFLNNKDITLEEQIDIANSILNVEEKLEKINNNTIKNNIINKSAEFNNINDFNNIINEFKTKEETLNQLKQNISKWKLLFNNLKSGKKLKENELREIKNIIKETPNNISKELWLDIDSLKSAVISYSRKETHNANELNKTILNKKRVLKKEIDLLKERKVKIENKKEELKKLKEENNPSLQEFEDNLKKEILDFDEKKKNTVKNVEEVTNLWLDNAWEIKKLEDLSKYISETKKIESKDNDLWIIEKLFIDTYKKDIDNTFNNIDDIKNISTEDFDNFVKTWNVSKENLDIIVEKIKKGKELSKEESSVYNEKKHRDYIEKNLKKEIEENDDLSIKIDEIKWNVETISRDEQRRQEEKNKVMQDALNEIDNKVIVDDVDLDDSSLTPEERYKKQFAKDSSILKSMWWKAWILAENEWLNENTDKKKKQKEDFLRKKISLATSNISTKIDELNQELKKENLKANKDEKIIEELDYKIKWYNELKDKLYSNDISNSEKEWLLWLLWKWDWLKDYINHRSNNYWYTQDFISKKIKDNKNVKYEDLEDWYYKDLFLKWLEEEKFSLIEDFSKLKNEIPWFENVWLTEDYVKLAKSLWINDDETFAKIAKLQNLQSNIKDFNLDIYTWNFLDKTLHQKRLWVEHQMQVIKEYKDNQLGQIDKMEWLTDFEKEKQQVRLLENFDKRMQSLIQVRDKINNEIWDIEKLWVEKWKFNKNDIKDISNNIELFSIVWNIDKYGNILNWISDDITNWNTDFINFQSAKNISEDIYTNTKISEILKTQKSILDETIDLLWDNSINKTEKYKLVQERSRIQWLLDKMERWDFSKNDISNILSTDNLYSWYLMWENLKLYKEKETSEWENLEKIKKNIEENNNTIDSIKKKKFKGSKEIEKIVIDSYNIDTKELVKEWGDGYDKSSDWIKWKINAKLKSWKATFSDIKNRTNVIKKTIFDWEDVELETSDKRNIRHAKIEKYLSALFSSWFALFFLFIFSFLNNITNWLSKIPRFINWRWKDEQWNEIKSLITYIEKNKLGIFTFTVILLWIITLFADKNQYQFININTHLFSLWNYWQSAWNLKFSDWSTAESIYALIYYKMNIYLFFIYVVVFYQIVLEFLYKYLLLLRNPTIWLHTFIKWSLKLIIFFFMLWLIFKVNTVIL